MPKRQTKTSWFHPRTHGWAWGLPVAREGWIVYAVFVAVWLGALLWLILPLDTSSVPTREYIIFGVIIFTDIAALIALLCTRGASPKKKVDKRT